MTDLTIHAVGARAERHAAVPTLVFDLALEESTGQLVESIALGGATRPKRNET